jgi:hypothetical protein
MKGGSGRKTLGGRASKCLNYATGNLELQARRQQNLDLSWMVLQVAQITSIGRTCNSEITDSRGNR